MKPLKALLFLLFIVASLPFRDAVAADLPGSKDHPLLKRFAGSEIVAYQAKRFDEYELQTSTFSRYNFATKKREYLKPPLKPEGRLTRIWYEAAGDYGSLEIYRNYLNELRAKGFVILYDSKKDPAAIGWINYLAPFGSMDIQTNRSNYIFFAAEKGGICVASAKKSRPEGDVYVQLIAVEWGKNDPVYKAKRGAYIAVDVVETQPMVQKMVTVSADQMTQAITSTGRVSLYGIYFDTNKSDIKPASSPALVEIAKLMKSQPALKLHVVGHTDNVGGYEFNMGLSKRRADAVVASLVRNHGIAPARLAANGVAYLAPVAPNTTEAGRAKNRRVELVPR
ncbi:MAG: OmpA family protein [Chlorobium phaeobacteroides]|jgi:outer membrane protein OmpA-like peptidoglycan-associated protein|nr:OmpA family protein [Chlorobium phaeobacteroides]